MAACMTCEDRGRILVNRTYLGGEASMGKSLQEPLGAASSLSLGGRHTRVSPCKIPSEIWALYYSCVVTQQFLLCLSL